MIHPLLNLVTQFMPGSMRLSTFTEVTVRDRDVTVEPIGIYLRRVTGMSVLNQTLSTKTPAIAGVLFISNRFTFTN